MQQIARAISGVGHPNLCEERMKRMEDLPVKPLPEDAVDIAARAVAAEVAAHIREMYPAAAAAVSMKSMTRSLSGVIRNNMARLGRAAERGEIEAEANKMRSERMRISALRRKRKRTPY